ncbi:MAG TPA: hypothetical protein VIJ29_03860 [Candidatus Paceibacterota bacterium]
MLVNGKRGIYTHQALLKDLSEIKEVLKVESQLIKELVKLAIARQTAGFEFRF